MFIRINNNLVYICNEDLTEFLHIKRCLFLIKNYNIDLSFEENIINSKRYICKEFFKNKINE